MVIQKIELSEFPNRGQGLPSEEGVAIKDLSPGEGIKFPCRWDHKSSVCPGINLAHSVARRNGWKVRCACYEKTVFVIRPEENF